MSWAPTNLAEGENPTLGDKVENVWSIFCKGSVMLHDDWYIYFEIYDLYPQMCINPYLG